MDQPTLLGLERAALRAWPALESIEAHGFVLRFARGYTQRSNSATALAPAEGAGLLGQVEACERAYRARGLPPIFRLPSLAAVEPLDALLAARGYREKDPSLVLTRPLEAISDAQVIALGVDDFLPLYERFNGRDGAHRADHRALLEAIPGSRLLASVAGPSGAPGAVALAVADGPWVGIFDVATDPAQRRQGLGRRLMDGLLGWGARQGARTAYLQVMAENAPALRLYEAMGFAAAYRYWYRVQAREA
jgi:ribosomal protein S18 acetylase RimI-like enzyme